MESSHQRQEWVVVYAEALFDLARERGQLDAVRRDLAELAQALETVPDLKMICEGELVDKDQRGALLERVFRGKVHDLVLNALLVLNENGRRAPARALHRWFELKAQQAAGEIEGSVVSAVELEASQREEISRLAARLSGKQPILEYRVDPELLGGLILQIGDWRYDNSIRRHLGVARRRLAERGEVGLSVGATAD